MKTFDELTAMSADELDAYFEGEAEAIIKSAPYASQGRLIGLLNTCKLRARANKKNSYKGASVAFESMWESFQNLRGVMK